ncbi:hypothetical protein AMAG_02951 [Allomyces macrogynus ATCC 38327]|uniref:EXPERA domain-containing protein n=1 Tax=Allomyces macrogynus (strain ATCC 38327) TaxID=578462 RepID=A0A0L0S454_ALLM3|nr:hypothetical protein AMAG_02951 [Allomyces macrogynus ATCC 38327]|eukprot:KNE57210.1 hypothetical protein AMAG_02951 [Allomyces macrogynus ATCC 38327]
MSPGPLADADPTLLRLSRVVPRKMASHPFIPASLDLPHYVPNTHDDMVILGGFAAACGAFTLLAFASGHGLPMFRRTIYTWCWLSGIIHMALEGYFVVNVRDLAAHNTLLGQVWKEYAKCDSRYMWGDRAVWIIEAITSFVWGPLLWLMAIRMRANHTKTNRYLPWLLLISTGQLYGTIVYFYTSLRLEPLAADAVAPASLVDQVKSFIDRMTYDDGIKTPFYFWVYFFFMNFIWVVVPSIVITWALRVLTTDPPKANAPGKKLKTN